jgi:biotin synthase
LCLGVFVAISLSSPTPDWSAIGRRACEGGAPTRDEALAALRAPDTELLPLLHAASLPRERHFGRRVRVHVLQNAKSGLCPEDCGFCSQSSVAAGPVKKYRMLSKDELVEGAERARAMDAVVYCMVTSTREPSEQELETVCAAAREIRGRMDIRLCASLGLLTEEKARRLKDAGVDRFNHNLETTEARFPSVCSTHTWRDRVETVRIAQRAGMVACCGGIFGMGETDEDRVEMAFTWRELGVESIPVNFLDPRPGTPLGDASRMSPAACLKALALVRLVNPSRDIRLAGGRETNVRALQPLALYAVNSIFTNGYLTTPGQGPDADRRMIEDAGFEIDGDAFRAGTGPHAHAATSTAKKEPRNPRLPLA